MFLFLLLLFLLSSHAEAAPDKQADEGGGGGEEPDWQVRRAADLDQGQFLGVPIFYGDWVPITNAKSTIQAVAAR